MTSPRFIKARHLLATALATMMTGAFGTGHSSAQNTHSPAAIPRAACPVAIQKHGVCHAAGYAFESVVFNANEDDTDLPLVIALHWSSSEPKALLKALGAQTARFRMVLPYAKHHKRDGFSFFAADFYGRPLQDQRQGVEAEGSRLAGFIREVQNTYQCLGPVLVTGASQGGDLSFQLAHDHPRLVAASFPMLGRNMVGRSVRWQVAAPVTAYFSLTDPIVDRNQADSSVTAIRDSRGRVEVKQFVADGHDISAEMSTTLANDLRAHLPRGCKA